MFRYPLKQLGDLLDRIDLGGWLLLSLGIAIVGATVLTPAWLEVQSMAAQRDMLAYQSAALKHKAEAYRELIAEIEKGEPILMQRLAWREFQLKPIAAEPVCEDPSVRGPRVDEWIRTTDAPPPPEPTVAYWHQDSRLLRMLTGSPRPWVLAFGGWLLMMGLLLNPMMRSHAEPGGEEADEGVDLDGFDTPLPEAARG